LHTFELRGEGDNVLENPLDDPQRAITG
jgi:hypothetical protein